MIIPYNSVSRASPPKVIQKEPNFMQVDDVMRIMECLQQEPLIWQVVIMLLIATGARRGGIVGLKWKNIDFESGNIRIDCALLYGSKIDVYEEKPKTSAGYNTIGVSGEMMELLRRYGVKQNKQKLRIGVDRERRIMFSPTKPDDIWIVNRKSDRFYKVRDLLNSAGDKYPSVPCKRTLLNQ